MCCDWLRCCFGVNHGTESNYYGTSHSLYEAHTMGYRRINYNCNLLWNGSIVTIYVVKRFFNVKLHINHTLVHVEVPGKYMEFEILAVYLANLFTSAPFIINKEKRRGGVLKWSFQI